MAKLKATSCTLGLALLLNLIGSVLPTSPVVAAPAEVKWSRVNIPTEGTTGNWVLANGSNVQHLTMANDGTLYSYANPSGTSYTLFKSTNGGSGWSPTGKVTDPIVGIATAPDDAGTIYYTTTANVYRSDDAGH